MDNAIKMLANATSVEDDLLRCGARWTVGRVLNSYLAKNLAFMREVSEVCQCLDMEGPFRFYLGQPMIGWCPGVKGLMQRVRYPDESIDAWMSRRVQRNAAIVGRVKSSGDENLDKMAYEKTWMR